MYGTVLHRIVDRKVRLRYTRLHMTTHDPRNGIVFELREKNANHACPSADTTRVDEVDNSE